MPPSGGEGAEPLIDDTFGRRLRTLARTGPLHQLARNLAHHGEERAGYDFLALQLAAIDHVMLHMGLASGTTREALAAALGRLAAATAPDRDAAEHHKVAVAVIDWLLNDNAPRLITYTDFAAGPSSLDTRMSYLREEYGIGPLGDDAPMLRATDEAINLLVGAIDLDLEDERVALELVLNRSIDRGHFDEAVRVGRRALALTIRYMEQLREDIARVLIDVRAVDLDGAVRERITSALAHLDERLVEDRKLRDRVTDVLDEATDDRVVHASRQLLSLLEQSARRNRELHGFLQRAPDIFLTEHRRQVLAAPRSVEAVDLSRELLTPLLAASRKDIWEPVAAFFSPAVGVRRLPRFSVAELVELLLTPPAEQADSVPEDGPPELVYEQAAERFTAVAWQAVLDALGRVGDSRRLSALLEDTRAAARARGANARDAAVLAALCVLGRFAPDQATEENQPASEASGLPATVTDGAAESTRRQAHAVLRMLQAEDTGRQLRGDRDIAGTDLLVSPLLAEGHYPTTPAAGQDDARMEPP